VVLRKNFRRVGRFSAMGISPFLGRKIYWFSPDSRTKMNGIFEHKKAAKNSPIPREVPQTGGICSAPRETAQGQQLLTPLFHLHGAIEH
jgi:hypothetical protein